MTSEVFDRDPAYWLDVAHPRRIDKSAFLLAGTLYGFGDEAQRFGNEASLENTDKLPELSLLRDPTLARNGLGSFLEGDRGQKLSNLLGSEQASLYSRQALRTLVEVKLADTRRAGAGTLGLGLNRRRGRRPAALRGLG